MHPATVLIVEDDTTIRMELRAMVSRLGHTVVGEADNGGIALAMVRSQRPDVVLLKVALPSLSGWEVARTLNDERLAPVILFTEESTGNITAQLQAVGALGFLSIPLRESDLGPSIAIAVARFKEKITLEEEVQNLNERMEARKLVGRAKAILMERHGLSERDAFRRIQNQSITLNRPVHEIARAIITASDIAG